MSREVDASAKALVDAVDGSELAREAMTPVAALRHLAPRSGEYTGRAQWSAMSAAGALRVLGVTLGYLLALAFDTRIKAAVTTAILVAGWLVGVGLGYSD